MRERETATELETRYRVSTTHDIHTTTSTIHTQYCTLNNDILFTSQTQPVRGNNSAILSSYTNCTIQISIFSRWCYLVHSSI